MATARKMSLQNRPFLKFYDYSVFLKMNEMGKLLHNWIDANAQGVAIENEIFTLVGLCCHHSILLVLFV